MTMLILFHPPPPTPPVVTSSWSPYIPGPALVLPALVMSFEYDFNELSHYSLGQVSQLALRTMRCENVVLEGSGIVCVSQISAGSD